MYTIKRVENSKPARYRVFFGSLPFSPAMTKQDALEYMQALENNTSIYGNWKGTNSRSQEYTTVQIKLDTVRLLYDNNPIETQHKESIQGATMKPLKDIPNQNRMAKSQRLQRRIENDSTTR